MGIRQQDLFKANYTNKYAELGHSYDIPEVGDVTFLNGQQEPVHRWFRLTPSFSPELVRFLTKYLDCDAKTLVCDPFLGKGTTAIEVKKLGIPFIGVEINPLLKTVSEYCTAWDVAVNDFASSLASVLNEVSNIIKKNTRNAIAQVVELCALKIPNIHNVFRWWKEEVLKDLLLTKYIINRVDNENYKKLLWVALAESSLDCANIHRNHPTITFDDNHNRSINVYDDFKRNTKEIFEDLTLVAEADVSTKPRIILGDSTKLSSLVSPKIDIVITSPPYPNRYSYVHATRPQLFFMDIFDDASQSADLDLAAIGGTWGKATSVLYNGHIDPTPYIEELLKPVIRELRPKSNLMCNYMVKYFNMMDVHIGELKKIVGDNFRGAYVVGNSRLKGVEVYTDIILADMFKIHGFNVDKFLVLRKRGGKKELFETAVCVSI